MHNFFSQSAFNAISSDSSFSVISIVSTHSLAWRLFLDDKNIYFRIDILDSQ